MRDQRKNQNGMLAKTDAEYPATKNKQEKRRRQAELGIQRVETKLSANGRDSMAALYQLRKLSAGLYTADSYISHLNHCDRERYQEYPVQQDHDHVTRA
ncbi:hypothetical protein [Aeromonas caviae]|uniref:hypothetical protein n=1 Tax=Aeromonas caviae TaxID=648 RepID=UPI002B46761E|nr:hypothetical protein [Aeromonas caviae]